MARITIREEELKNRVASNFFKNLDCNRIVGFIDFAVKLPNNNYLLWAEAKATPSDIVAMLTQLVLTIGKARTFDKIMPPPFLGCFDIEKIAFIPYSEIQHIFYQNDFNWKVTPSNNKTKEFLQVYSQIQYIIEQESCLFYFEKDEKELRKFINTNSASFPAVNKLRIDKNNFIIIYNKWRQTVMPTIGVNWAAAKKADIIDGDFFLADLLSQNNETIKDKLSVLLKTTYYKYNRHSDALSEIFREAFFNDNQKAHTQFWAKYERPPYEEYWDYIVNRRDLLVPQDVRESKGSFFTPQIWVEVSQKYLAEVLGEDWQDDYYIWDCAAGTGNLLAGLTNKYNIWASTLDTQDVDVMRDRIKNGTNLLESHVFQFDFLNDDLSKLPQGLQDIINSPNKRRKLLIYINPPYVEADNRKGEGRIGIGSTKIHEKYARFMGYTKREIYIQFLTRIYCEMQGVMLADFSTLKNLQAPRFIDFRYFFKAALLKCFIVPATTFDNVKGAFPIGFKIWNTDIKEDFTHIIADVYNENGNLIGKKDIWAYDNEKFINDWVKTFRKSNSESIATIIGVGSDFQNQRLVRLQEPHYKVPADNHNWQITKDNLIESCVYYAVRKVIPAAWLNDRDQFLYPKETWKTDNEFQNDCLAYTLFNNNIQAKFGTNHWIPFTEQEVEAQDKFESNFMTNFISGKKNEAGGSSNFPRQMNMFMLLEPELEYNFKGRIFSTEAQDLFDAGRALWRYYHSQITHDEAGLTKSNINASLYDIREYFQGRNEIGKMNSISNDAQFNFLKEQLRKTLKTLSKKIEPKIFEYGFLK